ncbi:MAG: hypothetical protein KAQ70_06655, partial [Candidatus Heimdallarchaeota archaeon]|nr:hypothetical protein [Candidatus Heimdallarchaeota archaeon]
MELEVIFTIIAIVAPLAGAFLSLLLKKWSAIRDIFSVSTIGISALSAVIAFSLFDGTPIDETFNWLNWSVTSVQTGFYLDSLSVLMGLIVSV